MNMEYIVIICIRHIYLTQYHIHNITHNLKFFVLCFFRFFLFHFFFLLLLLLCYFHLKNFLYSFVWKSIKYLFSQYYWSANRLTAFIFIATDRHRRNFSYFLIFSLLFATEIIIFSIEKRKLIANENWCSKLQVTTIV